MIVTLPMLKLALGIAADDASQDDLLTQLESQAAAWVEQATGRRWDQPIPRVEKIWGTGTATLYLSGTPAPVNADAAGVIVVAVRSRILARPTEWDILLDFELSGPFSLVRTDGYIWHPGIQYEVTYHDGFLTAPGDVQGLVIDLVRIARNGLAGASEAAIKSESIGDYSYTIDAAVTAAHLSLSTGSLAVINRRRRLHI